MNISAASPAFAGAPDLAVLVARPLALDTFRENVVVLNRNSLVLRPERLRGARKIEIRFEEKVFLASTLVGGDDLVGAHEVGLPQPLWRRLGIAPGAPVHLAPARPPAGLSAIRRKVSGHTLSDALLATVARELAEHRWSDMEVAAFLGACATDMTRDETLGLTRGMIAAGQRLKWGGRLVVDKHCIGGVPGNRTSLIVVPIVAAHGLIVPKTSSRAITSPAGTADTMEVFARVDLTADEMRQAVEATGGCIVWGGQVNLSPADDVLISVERPLGIDTANQMTASILSKKVAAGVSRLVLDIPVGPTAKVRTPVEAKKLRALFAYVAGRLGLALDVVLTDAQSPIGRGVGPILEARDVRAVLHNDPDAPADLREKSIQLAGRLLEADPAIALGKGEARARELLTSGAARRKMDAFIAAQGPSPIANRLAGRMHEVRAARSGYVQTIDCHRIANLARLAGAPTDPGAGIDICHGVGDRVRAGSPLYRLYGSDASDFAFAVDAAGDDNGMMVT